MEKSYKLGVLGAGNMGMAIVGGAVKNGLYQPHDILLFNRSRDKRARHHARGYQVTEDFRQVYRDCETVLLAIKPQNFDEVLPVLAEMNLAEKPLVVSIAAGVTFARMETAFGQDCPIIRVMPNTPLQIGMGASALVKNNAATVYQLADVRNLFSKLGLTAVFEREEQLNEIIPYNGSTPAYVYYFIESMLASAEQHGFEREDVLPLICQSFIGSAQLAMQDSRSPAELIDEVCSPGGTTIEAVRILKESGVSQAIAQASDACIKRAYELGK